jgi:DNA-binding transcriptional regulator YhcF (GntR family)
VSDMDIAYENKTIYSNINGQFVALVENGTIYQVNSFTGQRIQVGVVQQVFDELKGIADEYYQKLVDAGIIKEPKTNEQIIAEQQEMMAEMMKAITKLTKKVEELEDGHCSNDETV